MYGPKLPFLLMYGSHDMRHIGISRVDGLSMGPSGNGASQYGRHRNKSNIEI